MILAGSKIIFTARHCIPGRAIDAVKENERGSSAGILMPQSGTRHARDTDAPLRRLPQPVPSHCPTSLPWSRTALAASQMPGFTNRRSITTSMVWFLRLSSWMLSSSSSRWRSSPSMRARTKPCWTNLASSALNRLYAPGRAAPSP